MYHFVSQCSFITVVQRTVEKQQLQRRLCVGEFHLQLRLSQLDFQADFDTKLVNYFGGARSKGFATLRNVSKLQFFDKLGKQSL